jgi:hypothetical protein
MSAIATQTAAVPAPTSFPSNLEMSGVTPFRRRWEISERLYRDMERCSREVARTWALAASGSDRRLVDAGGYENVRAWYSVFLRVKALWLSEHLHLLFQGLDDPRTLATPDDFRALVQALQKFGLAIDSLPFVWQGTGEGLAPFEPLLNKRPLTTAERVALGRLCVLFSDDGAEPDPLDTWLMDGRRERVQEGVVTAMQNGPFLTDVPLEFDSLPMPWRAFVLRLSNWVRRIQMEERPGQEAVGQKPVRGKKPGAARRAEILGAMRQAGRPLQTAAILKALRLDRSPGSVSHNLTWLADHGELINIPGEGYWLAGDPRDQAPAGPAPGATVPDRPGQS